MELDEIIRLKQITGLKEMFANHVFSKSWEEFDEKVRKQANNNLKNEHTIDKQK